MDLAELLAQIENISALSDEEVAELLDNLRVVADERLDGDLSDSVLAELEEIATATEAVRTEQDARVEADEQRREQAQALADRIRGEVADAEADADDEVEAPAAEDEDAPATADDEEAPAEADEEVDANAAADDDADAERETVNASTPARPTPRIGRVAARRPAAVAPRPRPSQVNPLTVMTASANVPGIPAGQRIESPDQLVEVFARTLRASAGYRGPRVELPIIRLGAEDARDVYGADRTLALDPRANEDRIRALVNPTAVTAAGGICAPAPVRYDFPTIGTDARPVRDSAMANFGADRGGVRLFPPVTFDDVDGGVGAWTAANDENPSSPTTKPCVTMTCPDDDETVVEAITKCIEIGNFRARFFGEQVAEWVKKMGEWHARYAESRLLTTIGSGSTQVVTGTVLGTATDVLTSLDRALAGYVSRHRADPSQRLRFVAPFWLRNQMRTDLARVANAGTAEERLVIADATIDSFFAARNVNVTWMLDGESGQIFGPQPDAALVAWPSTVVTYLYAEGDWLFLDGGALDLGVVRDSTLNSTNDMQMFSETFEGAAFHGIESLRITMDVCPDGSTSAPIDINPCTTGS